MNDKLKWTFGGAWAAAALLALLLPVFLPSFGGLDPISAATAIMTVLSFPAGLLAIPFEYAAEMFFSSDPNSIAGMYLNVKILFGLGLMQWFLLVPRLLRKIEESRAETNLLKRTVSALNAGEAAADTDFFKPRAPSPVERVIDDRNQP
jgi:hypothetical protein